MRNELESYVIMKCLGEDELMHRSHKYIKREWKNGKWRYYYESKSGKRHDLKVASAASDFMGEDERKKFYNALDRYKESFENGVANGYRMSKENLSKQEKKEIENINALYKARYNYLKTPIGKIEYASEATKEAIKYGKDWIDSKISDYKNSKIKVKYEEAVIK